MCRRRARGHSLVELIVALAVLAALAGAAVGLLTVHLRVVRQSAARTEAGNAVRFAARLLRAELRALVPARDIRGFGPDSSSQRVFRGLALGCGASAAGAVVRYRGMRDPDPTKDSLLVLTAAAETAQAVVGVAAAGTPGCTPRAGETILAFSPAGALRPDAVALLFESGTWHLSAAALRYSRGSGGRQPATAATLVDDSTDMAIEGGLAPISVRLRLGARPDGSPASDGLLRLLRRVGFLNLALPLDSVVLAP